MFDRLEQLEQRYEDLAQQLSDPAIVNDQENYRKVSKQHRDLEETVEKFRQYRTLKQGIADAKPMLLENDPDMKAMAEEELAQLEPQLAKVEEEIKVLLLPKDPNDDKNIVIELRAGTGGDEASQFVAEMFRMYLRFAEQHKWKVEVLSQTDSDVGGLKDITAIFEGNKVYSQMKYESGVHRVQRVPATETQGRVHTSAITVAVIPEAERVHQIQAKERKQQIGTGDRSEKIRTYNFPQNRLTDHRIGLTNHNLAMVMEGLLQPTVDALIAHYTAEKMKGEPVAA